MRTPLRIIIILVLAAAGGLAFYYFKQERTDPTLTLYGNVDIREVDLAFRVSGRLADMHHEEGDVVSKGQVLAVLDDEPYRHDLAAAEARINRAEANLKKLEAGSRPQEIKSAAARVVEAEAVYTNSDRDYTRQQELFSGKATSRKAVDQAQARYEEARARLQSARESLALVEEGFRSEDILAARAELQEAMAHRDAAVTRLQDTSLTAPNDGILITRIKEGGSVVSAGTPVYTLSLQNPVYIRAYVSGPDLGRIASGTKVDVSTDSSAAVYPGMIGFISPRAEFTPKNVETPDLRTDLVYRVRITVEDVDNGLRQGMPVTIRLAGQEQEAANQ